MHKRRLAVLMLVSSISAQAGMASSMDWHHYVSIGMGSTYTDHSQDLQMHTSPSPGLVNRYNNHTWSHFTAQLAFGSELPIYKVNETSDIWLGLEGSYLRTDGAPGDVLPAVNIGSNFDRLNFGYDIESYLLMAKAKLKRASVYKAWGGYLDGSIGVAANRLSNYIETIPSGSTAAPMISPFGSNTRSSLAYGVGLGFTHSVGTHSELSIGYRYVNSGRAGLSTTSVQSTTQTLKSSLLGHHLLELTVRT